MPCGLPSIFAEIDLHTKELLKANQKVKMISLFESYSEPYSPMVGLDKLAQAMLRAMA